MAKFNRKRYFIDKQLQTKYIILTIMMLILYTLLFVVILLFPYIVALSFDYPLAEQTEAAKTLLILHGSIWPALGVVILIMSAVSILITHKIAGPVYRFKQTLAQIANGNLDVSIKLREKDDLKDLAEDLNMVISELRGAVKNLRGDYETMSSCINDLEDQIKDNQIDNEAGRALIEKMQARREETAQILDKYSK